MITDGMKLEFHVICAIGNHSILSTVTFIHNYCVLLILKIIYLSGNEVIQESRFKYIRFPFLFRNSNKILNEEIMIRKI